MENRPEPEIHQGGSARVFISYASQDAALANTLCTSLETAGFRCWIAPRDVQAGQPYAAAIVEAINACRLMVLVLTKDAIASPHVFREIERASSKRRAVLSIRMDAAGLPPELEYFLSANQWLDGTGGSIERIIPSLIDSVRINYTGKSLRNEGRASTLQQSPAPEVGASSEHSHGFPVKIPFLEQMKRRHVGRIAILYIGVCYLVLEFFSTFLHVLALPEWTGRTLAALMVAGFPAALIFAWIYEITPKGIKPAAESDVNPSNRKLTDRRLDFVIIIVLVLALIYFVADKFWLSAARNHPAASTPIAVALTPHPEPAATFAPPAHSIAVLPFVNMSGDVQQDYFSDGLCEELLNSLSRVTQLQVAARTSSFSFKGKQVDIAEIARKLNVGAILEGSVRKDGARVRITAQLIDTVSGFHLWSETYDRNLREIFVLQTAIATAVTKALQATLLTGPAVLSELGGTQNPLAFDAYLRGEKLSSSRNDKETKLKSIAAYSEAIRLDPGYAKAYVGKSLAVADFATQFPTGSAVRQAFSEARAAAKKALTLAPELGEAHSVLASVLEFGFADYSAAEVEHRRALALSPGSAMVLRRSAFFFGEMGRAELAVTNARRSVDLDPLNVLSHDALGRVSYYSRRYVDALAAYNRARSLDPHATAIPSGQGLAYWALGQYEAARAACATPPVEWEGNTCLAVVYHKLQRTSDADAVLAAMMASQGEDAAIQYAEIYAQWGNIPKALEWLETAYRTHDPGLVSLKTEPMLDPLREEPRFKAIEHKLKFLP